MEHLQLGDCSIDLTRRELRRGEEISALSEVEAGLLAYLAARAGRAVPRDELLREVWGYRADLNTRAVDNLVMRLRRKLESDPSAPRFLHTVRGVGYALELEAAQSEAPLGRGEDLARLEAAFSEGARLVVLRGPPGVGKTHLARAWAQARGALFCELADVRGADGVALAVAEALEVRGGADPVGAAGAALAARGEAWVVLDDFEQHVAFAAQTVGRWLEGAPRARLLVTSRERLRLREERVQELEPLAPEHAEALFLERAAAARAGFAPGEIERDTLRALVIRLDGLPLAIELAAARSDLLSPAQLLARMDQRLALLAGGPADAPPRHRSLQAALESSWALLDPPERAAMSGLALFRGGFSLEAAEAVLSAGAGAAASEDAGAPPGGPLALELLGSLRDKSLLTRRQRGDAARFALLESVRAFAARAAPPADAGAPSPAALRHARFYADRAEEHMVAMEVETGGQHMAWLVREQPNLRAAFERTLGARPALAARLALGLHWVAIERGPPEVAGLLERARAALPEGEVMLRIKLAFSLGNWWIRQERAEETLALLGEALALSRDAGIATLEARALGNLGILYGQIGRSEEAERCGEQALEIARREGLEFQESLALRALGDLALRRAALERAARCYEESLVLLEDLSSRPETLDMLRLRLAVVQHKLGELGPAERALEQLRAREEAIGSDRQLGTTLFHLSLIALQRGEPERARALAGACGASARRAGLQHVEVFEAFALALLAAPGPPARARVALRRLQRISDVPSVANLRWMGWLWAGAVEALAGDEAAARAAWAQADAMQLGDQLGADRVIRDLFEALLTPDRLPEALDALTRGDPPPTRRSPYVRLAVALARHRQE